MGKSQKNPELPLKIKTCSKFIIKKIQIETILRNIFILVGLAKSTASHNNNLKYKCKEIVIHVLMRVYIETTLENNLLIPSKSEEAHIFLLAITFQGIWHTETFTNTFKTFPSILFHICWYIQMRE